MNEDPEAMSRLCVSKYEQEGELPPAAVMSRMLFLETGMILNPTVLIRHLKQFGYKRIPRGWRMTEVEA